MSTQPDIPAALERLRALAKAATPDWVSVLRLTRHDGGWLVLARASDPEAELTMTDRPGDSWIKEADGRYLVALNPTVALAMLDVVALSVRLRREDPDQNVCPDPVLKHALRMQMDAALAAFAAAVKP